MSEEKTRVRFGFKPTAKGTVCFDVTAEATSAAEAAPLLQEGIKLFRQIAADEGFQVIEGNLEK